MIVPVDTEKNLLDVLDKGRTPTLKRQFADLEAEGRMERIDREYQHGFYTDIESDEAPRGLNEDVIRLISGTRAALDAGIGAARSGATVEEISAAVEDAALAAYRASQAQQVPHAGRNLMKLATWHAGPASGWPPNRQRRSVHADGGQSSVAGG